MRVLATAVCQLFLIFLLFDTIKCQFLNGRLPSRFAKNSMTRRIFGQEDADLIRRNPSALDHFGRPRSSRFGNKFTEVASSRNSDDTFHSFKTKGIGNNLFNLVRRNRNRMDFKPINSQFSNIFRHGPNFDFSREVSDEVFLNPLNGNLFVHNRGSNAASTNSFKDNPAFKSHEFDIQFDNSFEDISSERFFSSLEDVNDDHSIEIFRLNNFRKRNKRPLPIPKTDFITDAPDQSIFLPVQLIEENPRQTFDLIQNVRNQNHFGSKLRKEPKISNIFTKPRERKNKAGNKSKQFVKSRGKQMSGSKYQRPVETSSSDQPGNKLDMERNYQFGYEVTEDSVQFGHTEKRDEGRVEGEYFVLLPNGQRQVVTYYADETGYYPTIKYDPPLVLKPRKLLGGAKTKVIPGKIIKTPMKEEIRGSDDMLSTVLSVVLDDDTSIEDDLVEGKKLTFPKLDTYSVYDPEDAWTFLTKLKSNSSNFDSYSFYDPKDAWTAGIEKNSLPSGKQATRQKRISARLNKNEVTTAFPESQQEVRIPPSRLLRSRQLATKQE